jgi:CHAD domain-containing protein
MELELVLSPEAAARLPHLKLLAPLKQARARNRPVRVIWHDSPDAALAADGLALAERRDGWRLERMHPGPELWPPATPAPVLAEAPDRAGLGDGLPEPLLPTASFAGRAFGLSLLVEDAAVELTLLIGAVRSVVDEHPAARLLLSGPERETVRLALVLAAELELSVPRGSLAGDAIAVARGIAPAPRRLGAPSVPEDGSVADAFAHLTGHLTDVILHWAPIAAAEADGPEPVHQMRVGVRRLRSVLSVFASATACPSVVEAGAGLKALGAVLGPARDWDVFTAGVGAHVAAAFPAERAMARLMEAAERYRRQGYADLRRFIDDPAFRLLAIRLAALSATRLWEQEIGDGERAVLDTPLPDFAAAALNRRLKRVLAPGNDIAHLEPDELHAIRLHAKRLRYASEFFAPLFPGKATRRFIRRLAELQEDLGTLNDGAVAAGLLAQLPNGGAERAFAIGLVRGFVAAASRGARKEIVDVWRDFRKQEPFWT